MGRLPPAAAHLRPRNPSPRLHGKRLGRLGLAGGALPQVLHVRQGPGQLVLQLGDLRAEGRGREGPWAAWPACGRAAPVSPPPNPAAHPNPAAPGRWPSPARPPARPAAPGRPRRVAASRRPATRLPLHQRPPQRPPPGRRPPEAGEGRSAMTRVAIPRRALAKARPAWAGAGIARRRAPAAAPVGAQAGPGHGRPPARAERPEGGALWAKGGTPGQPGHAPCGLGFTPRLDPCWDATSHQCQTGLPPPRPATAVPGTATGRPRRRTHRPAVAARYRRSRCSPCRAATPRLCTSFVTLRALTTSRVRSV